MGSRSMRNERGMALLLSIFAMVVIGALVAGAFFVGRVEQVTGYNTVWATQAGEAAEAGLAHALNQDPLTYQNMPVWTPASPSVMALPTITSGGMAYTDTIRRLNNNLFEARSVGRRMGAGGVVLAEQKLSQLIRIAKPTIGVNAAITVQDPINFNGNAFAVDGYNEMPPGWGAGDCPTGYPDPGNTDDKVGIRSSDKTGAKAADMNNINGFPTDTVSYDPTITSDTFRNFLDYTYWTLSSQPGVKTLPLSTPYNGVAPLLDGSGACDKTAPLNLGEPSRVVGSVVPCYGFFPVVHGTNSQTSFAAGNRGQGILLIDGDLELVGGFEWVGLVLVRGKMKIAGTGNKIIGAILTEGVDLITAGTVAGNVDVQFSQCAVDRAIAGGSTPTALARGWAQVF
ncbi:MAG: hypothetical protein OEW44_03225 [Gemmatimonadota bacterium]|jgi:hypothetical protein|nr:hypothetical protein [Gemmatimonadota bacterium]